MPDTSRASSGRRIALVAALALMGGAAGAAVLYAGGAGSGNAVASACPAAVALDRAVADNTRGEVAAMRPLDEPFYLGDVAFETRDGKTTTIDAMAGRALLVNLWATWCPPCREEMPALEQLQASEGGEGFAVVPINIDTGAADKPLAFYADEKLDDLPFYRDASMGVFNDLKSEGLAFGLPVTLLVGPSGCARAVMNGPAAWSSPDAVRLIRSVKAGAEAA